MTKSNERVSRTAKMVGDKCRSITTVPFPCGRISLVAGQVESRPKGNRARPVEGRRRSTHSYRHEGSSLGLASTFQLSASAKHRATDPQLRRPRDYPNS